MGDSPENETDVATMMAQLAATHVKAVYELMDTLLDFTPGSLNRVDELISTHFPNGTTMERTPVFWGAYVGETVRRNLGGEWTANEELGAHLTGVGGIVTLFPVTWAFKRFENGEGDSVAYKYKVAEKTIRDEGGTIPSPNLPTAEELKAMMEAQDDDGSSQLPSAVFAVFLVVAAGGGKLEKKHMGDLNACLQKPEQFSSPLFRVALGAVPGVAEAVIAELNGNMLNALVHLPKAMEYLDKTFPGEAGAFKKDLLAFGAVIAGSSRGFLGFGARPTKGQSAALRVLAALLSLEVQNEAGL
jgi:hypothetical protein